MASNELQIGKNPLISSKSNRIMLVIIGALATGFAWRVRGDTDFGGMWGMFVPATLLTLLIYMVWGRENKMNAAMVGFLVVMMAVTANGWGTLNSQIAGILRATERPGVAGYDIRVNPLSGAFCIFTVGFGWAPLWAIAIGLLFSKKKFEFGDFFKSLIIYVVFRMLSEFVFSHLLIPLVASDAYDLFAESLIESNFDMSPWAAYVSHWKNGDWYESIAGGRNYAAMVGNFASSLGAIATYFYMRFALKDKDASKLEILICLIFGASITIADLWQFWGNGGLWGTSLNPPEWVSGWSLWEYFTGFFVGGFIMLLLIRYARKESAKERTVMISDAEFFPEKLEPWIKFLLYCGIMCGAAWINPLGGRVAKTSGIDVLEIIIFSVCGISVIGVSILYLLGKIKFPEKSTKYYSFVAFNIFHVLYWAIYFFAGHLWDTNFFGYILNPMMMIGFVAVIILSGVFYRKNKKYIKLIR